MKRKTAVKAFVAAWFAGVCAFTPCFAPMPAVSAAQAEQTLSEAMAQMGDYSRGDSGWRINWESKNQQYKNFTDLGHYFIRLHNVKASDFEEANPYFSQNGDYFQPACTATVKRNAKGEVIIGRNMDVEISQAPGYLSEIEGGKYRTMGITYTGAMGRYHYDELDKLDADDAYRKTLPFTATDAMNEKGLYVEMNMREMDSEYDLYCASTNPGKERASLLSLPALVTLNCATVPEALEFIRNSYDWYAMCAPNPNQDMVMGGKNLIWNLAFVIGDAEGNYGLVEFFKNKVLYTPYANAHVR